MIGDLLDTYTKVGWRKAYLLSWPCANGLKKHGKFECFLEWGRNHQCDYICLTYGLEKAGKEHLLPPKPIWQERPLWWWSKVRDRLRLTTPSLNFSLSLGNLYRLIYKEDVGLYARWHHAGADVVMTMYLIHAYFCRVNKAPLAGNSSHILFHRNGMNDFAERDHNHSLEYTIPQDKIISQSALRSWRMDY
jgi:hypothetical protein